MAGLRQYRAKRDFASTSEPRGVSRRKLAGHLYVIQKHAARRLHYDLRLELDGVLKSWAVTRGPSLDPTEKRLAVEVEDHPVEYADFEGTIPQGQYGGGKVIVWDRGTWAPDGDPHAGLAKGHLDFLLEGEKLRGRWHLVRMQRRSGEKRNNWLLIKGRDEFAAEGRGAEIGEEKPWSVLSGRPIDEVGEGDDVWDSATGRRHKAPAKASAVAPRTRSKPGNGQAKESAVRGGIPAHRRAATAASTKRAVPERTAARASTEREATRTSAKSMVVKRAAAGRAPVGRAAVRSRNAAAARQASASAGAGQYSALPGAIKAPMPDFIPPCLASLQGSPPEGGWLHEIKFDGYRLQPHIAGGKVRLYTRRGLDWTAKFGKELPAALGRLAVDGAILDGELVVEGDNGASNFSLLQEALSEGRTERFIFYAFDLLYAGGCDLREVPLIERKQALKALLATANTALLRFSEHFTESGALVLQHACRMGLEGIISKRPESPYRSGRGTGWLKSKCLDRQEFVIGGFVPSTVAERAIGSLAVGYYDAGKLAYAGRVGTGYSEKTARDLYGKLAARHADSMPFAGKLAAAERRGVVWVRPELVAEVEFRGWTGARMLRQAAFLGVREDKAPSEVVREEPQLPVAEMPAAEKPAAGTRVAVKPVAEKPAAKAPAVGKAAPRKAATARKKPAAQNAAVRVPATVKLTHPDRVYWPDVGVTKQRLAEYYAQVWKWMAPHLVRRPLSLLRCPDGIGDSCFFQKQPWQGLHESILVLPNAGPGGDRMLAIDSLDGLTALVQAGVLEIHPWGASLDDVEHPDRLIFDLDPGADVPWSDMVKTAVEVRERLKRDGLSSFVKTTGGKGLHVVAPLVPKADWDEVKGYAHRFAEAMIADKPQLYAATMAKRERVGHIFIDYLRNGRGATAVAPYSTRARAGAPVSMPIAWDELPEIRGDSFHVPGVDVILGRLGRGDPWARFLKTAQSLPTATATKKAQPPRRRAP
jgi:bifunctional non-homologous end joining protein LigD